MSKNPALNEYFVEKLHENGFASVAFEASGSDIDPLFITFREVLADVYGSSSEHGQTIVEAFATEVPGRPLDSRGYIKQRRVGQVNPYERGRAPGTDNKDIFQFTPQTLSYAHEYLRTRGGMPRLVHQLLEQCTDLYQVVKAGMKPVVKALGVDSHIFAPIGHEHENVHILRIIRYLGSEAVMNHSPFISQNELAELHFDRSKFTAAVWESGSGLVGAAGHNWRSNPNLTVEELDDYAQKALATPIRHRSGILKVFSGAGYYCMPKIVREASGNIPMLLHGVIDDRPGEERDAIVLFTNEHAKASNCSAPNKLETGFSDVRSYIFERQERHGDLVA